MRLADEAFESHPPTDGNLAISAWRYLTEAARERRRLTLAELKTAMRGTVDRTDNVDNALWMVRMYCGLSSLPALDLIVSDFAPLDGASEDRLAAVMAFDWQSVHVPEPSHFETALWRLTSQVFWE